MSKTKAEKAQLPRCLNGCGKAGRFKGFCSNKCKREYALKTMEHPQLCGRCSQYFESPTGNKTCPECLEYNRFQRGKVLKEAKLCVECGDRFVPKTPNQVTCSTECRLAQHRRINRNTPCSDRYDEVRPWYIMSGCPWERGEVKQIPYGGIM